MDEGLSRAVLKVFVELYNQGLIYKDKRLVNWDPRLQTAVSDLEVENIEIKGHLEGVARATIEEKILALQATKRALADAILAADNGVLAKIGREELEALLA